MRVEGEHLIGAKRSAANPARFRARNPATGEELDVGFAEASAEEIDRAVDAAAAAMSAYRRLDAERRAEFLEAIARHIDANGDAITERATAETGLPAGRIEMERGRTNGQLRLFAKVVRDGAWVRATVDHPIPDRTPVPKPDLRRMLIPTGPVAIFGASNFPLAFSVAGGDTASALAAGCPVVVKGHPAHPGTSEVVGRAILAAAEETGMPEGVFSLLQGASFEVGRRLVTHPSIEAVGFTGSYAGGKGLFDVAMSRPRPIPVFAEMGSVNPIFLLPSALDGDVDALATSYVGSLTLGVGQFCTNPGLLLGVEGDAFDAFRTRVAQLVRDASKGVMLHEGIAKSYTSNATSRVDVHGLRWLTDPPRHDGCLASPAFASISGDRFEPAIADEVFGPFGIAVGCADVAEMVEIARRLPGQLTATIQGSADELGRHLELVDALERLAGRVVFNAMPTGVEVCAAMHHGGPFPATTDVRTTSVGTAAIERFVRPICYQGFPDPLLPPELRESNPRQIARTTDF